MPGFEIRGLFKRLLDSRLTWDALGHLYNRRISILLEDVYRDIVEEVEPPLNARILDVGCGPGFFSVMLSKRYPDATVTGIDYSATEIRAAKKLALRLGVAGCHFIKANAMEIPFEDASFDQVVSTFSIKHWPDRERGLSEIERILVPGGKALITEYHRDCTSDEYGRFYERVEAVFGKYLSALPTTPRGVRWTVDQGLSMDEAAEIARGAGFEEISAGRIEGWPYMKLIVRKQARDLPGHGSGPGSRKRTGEGK